MIKNHVSGKQIVNFLNELLTLDPNAINSLFAIRVLCNKKIVKHQTVQVAALNKDAVYGQVGILGLLNGMFGIDKEGWGCITVDLKRNGKIIKFALLKSNTKGLKREKI